MNNHRFPPLFPLSVFAGAVSVALSGAAFAEESEATEKARAIREDLASPSSRIEAGIGFLQEASRRRGQYNGMTDDGFYALLNVDLIRRNDETGTWLKLAGRNLGLDSREIRLDHERQGDWAYYLEYNQAPRYEPLVVRTRLSGIGTTAQNLTGVATARDVDLKMDRDTLGLGVKKYMLGKLLISASFKQEEKTGERMYGRGTGSTIQFLTEPLDRTTRQWDLAFSYFDRKWQLSGGYSGSAFVNEAQRVDTNTTLAAGWRTEALPPGNLAHQFHLSGGYNFSDVTRASFKLSKNWAKQNDPLVVDADNAVGKLAGSPSSLNGKRETTLGYFNLSSSPVDRLDLTANLRYQNTDDQTPVYQFISASAPSTQSGGATGLYQPKSFVQVKGLLEAGYQLPDGYRLVAGAELEHMDRNLPPRSRMGYRKTTEESQLRLEIKRNLSETLNGSIALIRADRGGSHYELDTIATTGTAANNTIQPIIWADRKRDKIRLLLDWIPDEQWSLQMTLDQLRDKFDGRWLGPQQGKGYFGSLDASYAISEKWKASGWLSREYGYSEQDARTSNAGTAPNNQLWQAQLRQFTDAMGISLRGEVNALLKVGADLSHASDRMENNMNSLARGTTTGGFPLVSLPPYFYRVDSLKLFADYTLEKNSGLRVDLGYDRLKNDDWTWQNWTYSDGTTVSENRNQAQKFLGVTFHQTWR